MYILISCISLGVFYTLYRYRYTNKSYINLAFTKYLVEQVMYAVFNFLLNINLFYTMKTRKTDGFYKKIELLFKNYDDKYFYLEEHSVVENGKEQNIVFVSDTKNNVKKEVENFKINLKEIFEKRNLIVYCGVKDNCMDLEDDITSEFRSFMYYFDKEDFTLDIFFSYLNINIDSEIILYKNDNNFTEKNFRIKDILTKTFIELLLF